MSRRRIILASLLLLVIAAIVLLYAFSSSKNPYMEKQEDLANKLGVKIKDYPSETVFPVGYFYTILRPGMSVDEVHIVVQGYEKAFRCRSPVEVYYYSEIYYYFHSEDLKAVRFQIFYDKQERFEKLQGEDDDSRTISTEGCEIGQIEK